MHKLYLVALGTLLSSQLHAQDFPGFRTGRYAGVNGVFYNPSSIAGSPYRFDVNLFSMSTTLSNNQAAFRLDNIADNFEDDKVKDEVFGKEAGPSSGLVSLDFHGPSFMFNVGKKNTFAVTSRARVFANITDIDGKLFDKISSDFEDDPSLPYTISSNQNMFITVNGWTEFGASFARVISDKGPHHFKAGVSLKYLAGAGNAHVNINNFNATIQDDIVAEDVYLRNATGRVATGFGGISFSDFEAGDLMEMESTGFGADLGFTYEFHPANSKNYKLKVGVALTDLGAITYEKDMQRSGAYNINITDPERMSLQDLDGIEFDNLKDFFEQRPLYFTPDNANNETEYKVSLPTTLQLDADYHVASGFYLNLAGQFGLGDDSKGFNNKVYTSMTFTPRFETKKFGFYVPVNYNELSKFNAGASLRMGPLFVGSGSFLTALLSDSKQMDFHVGLRFGGLR